MKRLVVLLALAGCGDDGGSAPIDAAIDAPIDGAIDAPPSTGTFALTSPTITDGGAIPPAHACTSKGGMNLSPQLAFANPPAGTMSYAVVLTDLTNGLVHSAIYDIPGTFTALPQDVDKVYAPPDVPGAHQTNNYSNTRGYAGPCPPNAHMYQLEVYALATATVPGSSMTTSKDELVTALATNLGTATLTGTFTPP